MFMNTYYLALDQSSQMLYGITYSETNVGENYQFLASNVLVDDLVLSDDRESTGPVMTKLPPRI